MSKGAARRDDLLLCFPFSTLVFLVSVEVHSSFIADVTIDYELNLTTHAEHAPSSCCPQCPYAIFLIKCRLIGNPSRHVKPKFGQNAEAPKNRMLQKSVCPFFILDSSVRSGCPIYS